MKDLWGKRYVVKHDPFYAEQNRKYNQRIKPEPLMSKIDNGNKGTIQIYTFRVVYKNFETGEWVQKDFKSAYHAQEEIKKAWRLYNDAP